MKRYALLFFAMIMASALFSQIKATTENGKKVILRDDWTWSYEKEDLIQEKELNLDCSNLIKSETDKMTGNSYASMTEPMILSEDQKKGIGINLVKSKSTIIFRMIAFGEGCLNDSGKANFLFRDGTRIEVMNSKGFNCDGEFTFYLKGTLGNRKRNNALLSKEVEAIRVWTRKSYIDKELDEYQSKELKAALNCIIDM